MKKNYTLVEVLVLLAIIAILAGIFLPLFCHLKGDTNEEPVAHSVPSK